MYVKRPDAEDRHIRGRLRQDKVDRIVHVREKGEFSS